jgi:hypothetical protein
VTRFAELGDDGRGDPAPGRDRDPVGRGPGPYRRGIDGGVDHGRGSVPGRTSAPSPDPTTSHDEGLEKGAELDGVIIVQVDLVRNAVQTEFDRFLCLAAIEVVLEQREDFLSH